MKDFLPRIFRIQRYSIHDGPGIRTTLFFQGCPLACPWCHNPESQAMIKGTSLSFSVESLINEIEKDVIYFDESGGGITFSGGEPLCQPDLLMGLLGACREREIHTCLDTSGYAPFSTLEPAARIADLVLYDVKIADEAEHRALTGHSSRPVFENLEKLNQMKVPVRLRFPLIPTMTDTPENLEGLISFLTRRTQYREIHILPFHNTGTGKYTVLERANPMKDICLPTPSRIAAVADLFAHNGFNTHIGG